MARIFTITTTAPDSLSADAKGRAQAVFTVTNATARPIRGLAKAKPLGDTKREWLSVQGETERDFAAGSTQQFTVRFDGPREPASVTPAGSTAATAEAPAASVPTTRKYPFRLDVSSARNPDEDFTEGPTVNGSRGDDRGFVVPVGNAPLENDTSAVKVIETHPKWENNGNITGVYTLPRPITAGDKFRTRVGFLKGAGAGNVRLRVLFNGSVIDEISKSYDGSLRDWTVNLGDYAGQQGEFSLQVLAIPTSAQAWLCWINPRIER
jgi:hypothetical protein